jgi:hypothetical protein
MPFNQEASKKDRNPSSTIHKGTSKIRVRKYLVEFNVSGSQTSSNTSAAGKPDAHKIIARASNKFAPNMDLTLTELEAVLMFVFISNPGSRATLSNADYEILSIIIETKYCRK